MTQQGFEDYLYAVFDKPTGAVKSYITALRIVDELFAQNDVFKLGGQSVTCICDTALLVRIAEFVNEQQKLYIKGENSFFKDVKPNQVSYPGKRFCSAAINHLLKYHAYDKQEEKAQAIVANAKSGGKVSAELTGLFKIKEGKDIITEAKVRLGQDYFRKMVLANYGGKCCVTGLNVPQILRASHIVAWKDDKKNRLNPENGLCLSATYDAAFDKHLISFDDDYRMVVSKDIKDYYTSEVVKDYFDKFEGLPIISPVKFMPNKKLLERHRELCNM